LVRGASEVLNQRSGQYFYAHAFNILSGRDFFARADSESSLFDLVTSTKGWTCEGMQSFFSQQLHVWYFHYSYSMPGWHVPVIDIFLHQIVHDCVHVLDVVMIF